MDNDWLLVKQVNYQEDFNKMHLQPLAQKTTNSFLRTPPLSLKTTTHPEELDTYVPATPAIKSGTDQQRDIVLGFWIGIFTMLLVNLVTHLFAQKNGVTPFEITPLVLLYITTS
jgi:hypothetical protein